MSRNPSAHERSRSPIRSDDHSEIRRRDRLPSAAGVDEEVACETPQMPAFLQLSRAELQSKFDEIVRLERNRLLQSANSTSPDSQWSWMQSPQTRRLDRYAAIFPWSKNRVRLQVPEGHCDYINASAIALKGAEGRSSTFIAMQGPVDVSSNHVWRMVWHEAESPAVIVMLTETEEAGQEKCFQYFPKEEEETMIINEIDEFGDGFKATVTCAGVEISGQNDAIEVRRLILKNDGQDTEKTVWHLLYTKWPDYGVPAGEDLEAFNTLLKLSQTKNLNPTNPRVVHCSAGVGRTGTFIALDHLMDELVADSVGSKGTQKSSEDDLLFNTVNNLRMQRRAMVYTESQYLFIHQVLKRLWIETYQPQKLETISHTTSNDSAAVSKSVDVFT